MLVLSVLGSVNFTKTTLALLAPLKFPLTHCSRSTPIGDFINRLLRLDNLELLSNKGFRYLTHKSSSLALGFLTRCF